VGEYSYWAIRRSSLIDRRSLNVPEDRVDGIGLNGSISIVKRRIVAVFITHRKHSPGAPGTPEPDDAMLTPTGHPPTHTEQPTQPIARTASTAALPPRGWKPNPRRRADPTQTHLSVISYVAPAQQVRSEKAPLCSTNSHGPRTSSSNRSHIQQHDKNKTTNKQPHERTPLPHTHRKEIPSFFIAPRTQHVGARGCAAGA